MTVRVKPAAVEQNQSLDFFLSFDGGANMAESSPSADEILSLWDFRQYSGSTSLDLRRRSHVASRLTSTSFLAVVGRSSDSRSHDLCSDLDPNRGI